MARIIANAGARQEQKEARERADAEKEAARERIRISQCTVPFLKIGCPPKGTK